MLKEYILNRVASIGEILLGTSDVFDPANCGMIATKPDNSAWETPPPEWTDISPQEKTWTAYKNKFEIVYNDIDTYFTLIGSDGNNNNWFESEMINPETLKIEGRAGFYHRYGMVYSDMLNFYADKGYQVPGEAELRILIPESFMDISMFPNLVDIYKDSMFFDEGQTNADIAAEFYVDYFDIEIISPGPPPVLNWNKTELSFSNLDIFTDNFSYEKESEVLRILIEALEAQVNITQNPILQKAFTVREVLNAAGTRVLRRSQEELAAFPSIEDFYIYAGINDMVAEFSVGLLTPAVLKGVE